MRKPLFERAPRPRPDRLGSAGGPPAPLRRRSAPSRPPDRPPTPARRKP